MRRDGSMIPPRRRSTRCKVDSENSNTQPRLKPRRWHCLCPWPSNTWSSKFPKCLFDHIWPWTLISWPQNLISSSLSPNAPKAINQVKCPTLLLKSVEVDDDDALLLELCCAGVDVYAGDSAVQTGRHRFCCSEDTVDLSLVLLQPYDAWLDAPRRQRTSHSQSVLELTHRQAAIQLGHWPESPGHTA